MSCKRLVRCLVHDGPQLIAVDITEFFVINCFSSFHVCPLHRKRLFIMFDDFQLLINGCYEPELQITPSPEGWRWPYIHKLL